MNRFLKELRYFWREVRAGYPRQRDCELFHECYDRILSLDLAEATEEQCYIAAKQMSGGRTDWAAKLQWMLYARVGRDKRPNATTLATLVRKFERSGRI